LSVNASVKTAEYGTFDNKGEWSRKGYLSATDKTIKVENGNLK